MKHLKEEKDFFFRSLEALKPKYLSQNLFILVFLKHPLFKYVMSAGLIKRRYVVNNSGLCGKGGVKVEIDGRVSTSMHPCVVPLVSNK